MNLIDKIVNFWGAAGVIAVILLFLSIFSWFFLLRLFFKLRDNAFKTSYFERSITEKIIAGESIEKIHSWIKSQQGLVPKILNYVLLSSSKDKKELDDRYDEASESEILYLQREFQLISSLVKSMPLLGLFGTVAGMVDTFSGLSGNADYTIIEGISKALLTTQLGLLVAIPGVFGLVYLKQKFNRLVIELSRLKFHINALREIA